MPASTYLGFNLLGLLLLGKIGASCLYLVELSVALSMTFPIVAADVLVLTRCRRWRSRLAAGGIALAFGLHVLQVWPSCRAAHDWPSAELTRLNRAMCQILGRVPGPALTEELGWLLVARRDPLVNPSHLAEAGAPARVKYVGTRRELVANRPVPAFAKAHDRVWADIIAQRFAIIQTNAVLAPRDRGNAPLDAWLQARSVTDQRFSPAWQQAIAEQYELRRTVGLIAIYTPRRPSVRPSVAHPHPPDADSSQ